jgi:hypothetical protein
MIRGNIETLARHRVAVLRLKLAEYPDRLGALRGGRKFQALDDGADEGFTSAEAERRVQKLGGAVAQKREVRTGWTCRAGERQKGQRSPGRA